MTVKKMEPHTHKKAQQQALYLLLGFFIDFGTVNDPKVFLAALEAFVNLTVSVLAAIWGFVSFTKPFLAAIWASVSFTKPLLAAICPSVKGWSVYGRGVLHCFFGFKG